MNPVFILLIILIFSSQSTSPRYIKGPAAANHTGLKPVSRSAAGVNFFDTFKMELLLDRMHVMTDTLERINHLNQMRNVPLTRDNVFDRLQESLDAVKGFLVDQKSTRQIETLSNTLNGVRRISTMESLMSSMGPVLNLLGGMGDGEENGSSRFEDGE